MSGGRLSRRRPTAQSRVKAELPIIDVGEGHAASLGVVVIDATEVVRHVSRRGVDFGSSKGDAFDAAPDAIVAVDADGVVRLVNRQAEAMFGYRRDELVGLPVDLLVPEQVRSVHAGHRASYAAAPVPRAMGPGLETAGRRRDGTEFPVEI